MTFNEAIQLKKRLGKEFYYRNKLKMRVIVTPAEQTELQEYFDHYRSGRFVDETAIAYSKNGQFKVMGIGVYLANVSFEDLTNRKTI